MKKIPIRFTAMALFGGAMIFSANAEKVRFEALPTEMRDKIKIHSGTAAIEDIDRQTKGGKTTYEVAFKKNGQHTELLFDERGQLVNPNGSAALDSRKIDYNEVPESVRKIADARLKGAEINDVDRQVKNGQATYEIGFKQNGQQQELVLSQDGRILNDSNVPESAIGAPAPAITGRSETARRGLPQPVVLSASQKIEMRQLPEAVQKAITTAAGGARVEDLERGTYQGRSVYQAAFKDNGQHIELQVRENGTILHDPRNARPNVPRGQGNNPAEQYSTITSLVPLSAGEKVERATLPAPVRRKLAARAGDRIEDLERGTWQGKTVYQAGFKDENGQHVEVQIDEQGNTVYDPAMKR